MKCRNEARGKVIKYSEKAAGEMPFSRNYRNENRRICNKVLKGKIFFCEKKGMKIKIIRKIIDDFEFEISIFFFLNVFIIHFSMPTKNCV